VADAVAAPVSEAAATASDVTSALTVHRRREFMPARLS